MSSLGAGTSSFTLGQVQSLVHSERGGPYLPTWLLHQGSIFLSTKHHFCVGNSPTHAQPLFSSPHTGKGLALRLELLGSSGLLPQPQQHPHWVRVGYAMCPEPAFDTHLSAHTRGGEGQMLPQSL